MSSTLPSLPDPWSAPRTLPALLRQQALQRPDAPALRFADDTITYAALHQRVLHASATLHSVWGVRSGDRVAYLGLNHPDQIVLLMACAQLGAVLVPINYRLAAAEWAALLAQCTPRCVVSDVQFADAAQALVQAAAGHGVDWLGRQHYLLHNLVPTSMPSVAAEPAYDNAHPHAPVLLVYTSGTTGLPKGALHTQENLLSNMALAQQGIALVATDLVATVLPLFHVGGLCIQTLPALYAGACVLLHARFDATALLRCIAQERPSLTLQVPATMKALVEHPDWPRTDISCLRAVWAGSSVLPAQWVQAFHARGVPVCNVYGSTETGPFSIALPHSHARTHAGSCGWPARSAAHAVEAKLMALADASDIDTADVVGELCIRAPNVVQHYWPDLPALDAQGYFHTGDLARRAADGSYTIVGRAKDMLISGGENIYPAELENLLSEHPGVADCAVIGLPHPQWGDEVVACVVAQTGCDTAALQAELAALLARKIARYKLPRRWIWCTALPKTALGKVQKDLLRQSF
jgi:fatty-acyl-CoA synthase